MQNENFYAHVNLDPMIDLDMLIRQQQLDLAHDVYIVCESKKLESAPLFVL